MLEESFWTITFFSPTTEASGTGVVFLTGNQIFGGDKNYYYIGNYNVSNGFLEGNVDITHFAGDPQLIFGKKLNVRIKISGKIQEPNLKLTGYVIEAPAFKVEINCTKRTSKSIAPKREGIFFNGQFFDAQSVIKDILSSASKTIVIIDNYLDDIVLDLLTVKHPNVKVNILARQIKPNFKASAITFNKQYGNLSIRTSKNFHDRFVIIDDKQYYHFGASIKDLGNLTFMFSAIEEQDVIDSIRNKFTQEWTIATVEV